MLRIQLMATAIDMVLPYFPDNIQATNSFCKSCNFGSSSEPEEECILVQDALFFALSVEEHSLPTTSGKGNGNIICSV